MIFVITFDKKLQDADFIRKDNGDVFTFNSVCDADAWIQENDARLCEYTKIIDTNE